MLQVTPVDCEPMTIVRQIQQIFDAELQSKKIEMEILKDDTYNALNIQWVRADPSRISQILINLLSNAIKFLDHRPERRIILTLGASLIAPEVDSTTLVSPKFETPPALEPDDIYLSFSIKDTGPGLKQAEMAALFQRFSQATPRTHVTYGGSGLGLFISKRLVELQGGRIYVDSVEGKGSTFAFFIKVGRSNRVDTQKVSPSVAFKGKQDDVQDTEGNQVHVLVVEDNLINQRLLKKQLLGSGYMVSVANHGQEAIDKIFSSQHGREKIDIVLMDVEMPILDVHPARLR
jgi:Histidine kinase-, DNA gyrase B-, and HSP90-like ATPase/Response regulator receiver domain